MVYIIDDEGERRDFFNYLGERGYFVQENVDDDYHISRVFACGDNGLPVRKLGSTCPRLELTVEDFELFNVIGDYVAKRKQTATAVNSSPAQDHQTADLPSV